MALPQHSQHPILERLRTAPVDDEPLTDEDQAALAEARADVRAGRVSSDTEVARRLGLDGDD